MYALALILPVLAFAGFLLWNFASREQQRLEGEAENMARSVATAIDRDLTGLLAALDVLALSPYLQNAEFEPFYAKISEIKRRHGIITLLRDRSGQQIVNARRPWGAPLPKEPLPELDDRVLATKRSYVSDLMVGAVAQTQIFSIEGPVLKGEDVIYFLNLSMSPDHLRQIFVDEKVPQSWRVAIVDRKGVIMARNERHEEFVGKKAASDFLANSPGREGHWTGRTVDGLVAFGVYATPKLVDWRVTVAISQSELNAPLWRSLGWFAALGLGLLALSTLLALVFGRRITAPIQALTQTAEALRRGEPIEAIESPVYEVNRVGHALATAASGLRERTAELHESNDEIQRFAYIVSHDLRAPLVNIMGFTSELEALRDDAVSRLKQLRAADADNKADEVLAEAFNEALGFIKTSIAKMDRLIQAILGLSRQGRREFKPEHLDMTTLLNGIAASLAHQAGAANATIAIEPLPPLTGDRLAIEQVFSNLVDNALKYLRPGEPGRIEVRGRAAGGRVIYEVRDNGRGIEEKDRERVFELFRRAGAQDKPGEGIGLAHVRALVRRLGGSIRLDSVPGRGSTFTVTLRAAWSDSERKAA